MKKLIKLFMVVLISVGMADVIHGIVLTFIYTPNPYSTNGLELASFLKYSMSAITVTLSLWIVSKFKNVLKSSKSEVKIS